MAASHDNFYVVTLIDRATGESGRVRDMVNGTIASRATFAGSSTTDLLGLASVYGYTATAGATLTLSTALLALGTPTQPFKFTVFDEGGNATTNNLIIDTEGSETINGGALVTISADFGKFDLYTDGTNYFAA